MIRSNIIDFFQTTIRNIYAHGKVENYVFDVYIDKNERVWLIDFNVWAERTDSLLFKWEELIDMSQQGTTTTTTIDSTNTATTTTTTNSNSGDGDVNTYEDDDVIEDVENTNPEIRIVMNANEVLADPLSSYRAPIDTVDLASESNNMGVHSFQDFMAMCQPPSAMNDSDDDDESQ